MAIHTSAIFQGFSGSIDRQLLFRQCGGKTIVSKFPDRSKVIYSEKQQRERRRFADAVSFARIVIANQSIKEDYSIKAAVLGFRSAWNVAIAEFMSDRPLKVKKKKIPFDKSQINYPADSKLHIKLFKTLGEESLVLPKTLRRKRKIRNISTVFRSSRCSAGHVEQQMFRY